MRILAIEASGLTAHAALLDSGRLIAESKPDERRSAQTLAPSIRQLLNEADWQPTEIGLVAVSLGPGSFTGLRVGVTTAKVFAWASGAEVLGVNTLDIIAYQADPADFPFHSAVDAHRKQVFTARYAKPFSSAETEETVVQLVGINEWLSNIAAGETIGTPMAEKLRERIPQDVRLASPQIGLPRAASLGAIAAIRQEAGIRQDLHAMTPQYYRPSAAEEKQASG